MNLIISLIIPVYNHASSLRRSLLSIVKQNYRPLEVIIVDDGSKDEIDKVLSDVSELLQGIPYQIIRQENRGAAAAKNRGFMESKGNFVIFWDADTRANPSFLRKMYQALMDNPEMSYAYSSYRFGWKKIKSRSFDSDELKKNNYIDNTSLIRKQDVVLFDEKLKRFQDWDLWLTLLEKGKKGIFVPECLFRKEVGLRHGISKWLPKIAYSFPWKMKAVRDFEIAHRIVEQKHGLGKQ